MPSEFRSNFEVCAFFDSHLKEETHPNLSNWHLPFILEEVQQRLLAKVKTPISTLPTAYSIFLQKQIRVILQQLVQDNVHLQTDLKAAFIVDTVAYGVAQPFRSYIENQPLPKQTSQLIHVIYSWLFTSLAKSETLNNTRFLDGDLTSPLELRFYLDNERAIAPDALNRQIQQAFIKSCNFSPPLICRVTSIKSLTIDAILSGRCVFGFGIVMDKLKTDYARLKKSEVYKIYQQVIERIVRTLSTPRNLSDLMNSPQRLDPDQIVVNYEKAHSDKDAVVCLDILNPAVKDKSPWHQRNAVFFRTLKTNQFNAIVVEDRTKHLHDEKGIEKNNCFTIVKVMGLKTPEGFVQAYNMILKLRGLSYYRSGISNRLDLLKEYTCYSFIHNNISQKPSYLLYSGPLLLSCEKLEVPYGREEKQNWIGFFLEEISVSEKTNIFTTRVRFPSDFWDPNKGMKKISKSAAEKRVHLDHRQVSRKLQDLAAWLWSEDLSVDYCDLVLFIDESNKITRLFMTDLERLSYGELVNETHPILDGLIDLRTRLRKEYWERVLQKTYESTNKAGSFKSFSEIATYLRPQEFKRAFLLRTLHSCARFFNGIKTSFGRRFWHSTIRTLANLAFLIRPLRNSS